MLPLIGQATEIQTKFTIETEKEKILEGESFDFTLVVWPLGPELQNELSAKLITGDFLDYFYVYKIYEKKRSENNYDAFEYKGRAVLKQLFKPEHVFVITLNYMSFSVDVPKFKFAANPNQITRFQFVKEKALLGTSLNSVIVLISFFIGLPLVILLFKFFKKKKIEKKLRERQVAELIEIHRLQSRDELEALYMKKDQVNELLEFQTPEMLRFYKVINDHQYQKDWDEDEREKILGLFSKYKESMDTHLKTSLPKVHKMFENQKGEG